MRVIRLADAPAVPWANGRGTTRELLRREAADGSLLLRLSVADVVEPGPFSGLPGLDRVLVVIDGPGFLLSIGSRSVFVEPGKPVAFAGEDAVAVTAIDGPSRDFNLMTARGKLRAEVSIHHRPFAAPSSGFVFVVAGRWSAVRAEVRHLDPGDLVEIGTGEVDTRVLGEGVAIGIVLTQP